MFEGEFRAGERSPAQADVAAEVHIDLQLDMCVVMLILGALEPDLLHNPNERVPEFHVICSDEHAYTIKQRCKHGYVCHGDTLRPLLIISKNIP